MNLKDQEAKYDRIKFLMLKALAKQCDGTCDREGIGHTRDVRVVHVEGDGVDWGYFSYCTNAIKADRRNDLTVTEI